MKSTLFCAYFFFGYLGGTSVSVQGEDLIMKGLQSGNPTEVSNAIAKLRALATPPHVIRHQVWERWVPQLLRLGRYQDASEICTLGIEDRPVEGAAPLLQLKVNALLALGQPHEALQAAKSFYNLCALENSADGVELIGTCLAALQPDDPDISDRLADRQALLDNGSSGATSSAAASTEASHNVPTIASIHVDATAYNDAINYWSHRNNQFQDRLAYGDILLVSDRSHDAEKCFRDLYLTASTPADLKASIEGIARSLRAEDGNLARANAWLSSLQQSTQTSYGGQ